MGDYMRIKRLVKMFIFFIIITVITIISSIVYIKAQPKLDINSANGYYIYDENNKLLPTCTKTWVSLNEISPHLINATISIEDKNFYNHLGFDILRIIKALYVNMKSGKTLQGASTISQQYAKNLWLDFDKTWSRKWEELWLTLRLEDDFSKEEILEGYLNTINYGNVFGIENASLYYFNKHAKDLNLAEASILAGIPKHPSKYSPLVSEDEAKKRQGIILNSMLKNKYITEKELNDALNTELSYFGSKEKNSSSIMYFQDNVINELKNIETIPSSFLKTGGLKIYTTLNIDIQNKLEERINLYMNNTDMQAASILTDPNTGAIKALIGGRNYSKSQFNRATTAKRHVGSTLKPFLYYSALENGFTPSTTFVSTKTTFVFDDDDTYSPKNYDDTYPDKDISMALALSYSDNIYAVKTHLFLGEDSLVNTLKRVGINKEIKPLPSLALGSAELSMLDMITAYQALANNGYKIEPYSITRVEDINGNVLYEHKEVKESVLNQSIVFILNELLSNCADPGMIDYSYPTCISINSKLTKKYALKTGSTDNDKLIFGFNNYFVLGIWAGYDDNKAPDNEAGSIIKNIWADVAEYYTKNIEDTWYDMPSNVVGVLVNPVTGKLATDDKKKILYYIKGTEPSNTSSLDELIPTIKED